MGWASGQDLAVFEEVADTAGCSLVADQGKVENLVPVGSLGLVVPQVVEVLAAYQDIGR